MRLFLKKYRRKIKSLKSLATVKNTVMFVMVPLLSMWIFSFVFYSSTGKFPVTVNPHDKTINENSRVNLLLASKYSLFSNEGVKKEMSMHSIVGKLLSIVNTSQESANISNAGGHVVVVKPGMRKEQVASAFGTALKWDSEQKHQFTTPLPDALLPFTEGSFLPGTYFVTSKMTPKEVQAMVNDRFMKKVLSNYGTSTEKIVPLKDALIIASIIQRETIGTDGMRLVSGIIWNRLFKNMNLQIDATLQYSKANSGVTNTWWPQVVSQDKYLFSPYNTYMHGGLPPEPIANPSIAAIVAALNPIETSCLFYFNDPQGNFHCSATYEEHKRLLKEHY